MSSALSKKVGVAAFIMTVSIFLSRLIGLAREMVIAHAGGAGQAVDAYQVAFMIPEVLNHVVASGFLSVTFIPIFARYLAADREAEGWSVFSLIMTVFRAGPGGGHRGGLPVCPRTGRPAGPRLARRARF